MFQCAICCEDVPHATEMHQLDSCPCRFCRQCVRQYCSSQVNRGRTFIQCPGRHCHNLFTPEQIRSLLTASQVQLYDKRLLDYEITNDPQRLFCPYVDCDQIVVLPDDPQAQSTTCPKCQNTFCLQCLAQWHPGEPCAQSTVDRFRIVCDTDSEPSIKECPKCRFPLERVDGCAQVVCVNCTHMFCWYCLKPLESDFFLLHYERGPCRNRLGHSRLAVFFHRLRMVGLLLMIIVLLMIASPLLCLMLPCLLCYGSIQLRNYFKKLRALERQSLDGHATVTNQRIV